ncbi:hypothetical protein L5515_017623 [Caenorhabditis briggsae]|uniref:Uncharacterized protein n=2 Tax=Caenorhabditis briggsae TaxID=6238 RepID=A0AAE9FE84_CAEBR|nr:hypothetical protein L5515_017623 [Caenorhabditis briggsae]
MMKEQSLVAKNGNLDTENAAARKSSPRPFASSRCLEAIQKPTRTFSCVECSIQFALICVFILKHSIHSQVADSIMMRHRFLLICLIFPLAFASLEDVELDSAEIEKEVPARFRSIKKFGSHQDASNQEVAAVSNEDNTDDPEIVAPNKPYLMADSSFEQEEECVALPNRTRVRPSFFQCKDDTKFELHGGAITNGNGDDAYPVSFNSRIRIFLDVTSSSNKRYDNLGVEVSIFKRSTGWFGCGWMFLPSFGLLSNYDMCDDNPSCPVSPGRQVIEFEIDPTKLFTNLFRMIHYDLSAYQLVIRLRDNRDPYRELLCATIQTRITL